MNNSLRQSGVLQGSILGSLFFNIFIDNIFLSLQKCELANYANDSTVYSSGKNINNAMTSLNHDLTILSHWFDQYFIVFNPDKMLLYAIWRQR